MFEVLTFGETMLRLTPPDLLRIEQATTFNIEIGGSESNTAVGLARLGLRTAWLSALPDNPLGRLVAGTLQRYGVDTSPVVWQAEGRLGLYFLEEGKQPRGSQIIYDRQHSVFSTLTPADIPPDLFQHSSPAHFHFSGISPALGEQCRHTTRHMVSLAQQAGWTISFDLNYRSKLCSPTAAQTWSQPFIEASTIFLLTRQDAITIYGLQKNETPENMLDHLSNHFPATTIILTLGKAGAMGRTPTGEFCFQPIFKADEVGRIGGGDAFNAGFLYGYLTTAESLAAKVRAGLTWGAATAALKYSTPGDMPIVDKAMVQALVERGEAEGTALQR